MKLRSPSPALVVALVALFVSLSGTAVAAGVVPMAKRALFANNAGKLRGKTPWQIAAIPGPATTLGGSSLSDVAAMPGPASTANALVSIAAAPFSLAPGEERDFSTKCSSGAKAISGGYTSPNAVLGADTRPTAAGFGWSVLLVNLSGSASSAGTVDAVCLG